MRSRMKKGRVTLSACATPNQGGQGLNLLQMIECLRESFDLTLYCLGDYPGVASHRVPPSRLSAWIDRMPGVRRLRNWQVYLVNAHFDRYVAPRIAATDIFQGVTSQCLKSLQAARALGCQTVLDVGTLHIEDF